MEANQIRRKHHSADFLEDTERLYLTLEAVGVGIWKLQLNTNMLFWDDKCKELFGLSKGNNLPYNEAIKYIHPEDVDDVNNAVKTALNGGEGGKYNIRYRIIGADKVLRWVHFSGQVYFNELKQPIWFGGIARDITALKIVKQQRKETADLLQSVFDSSVAGICVLKCVRNEQGEIIDFKYTLVNQVTEQINKRNDLVGQLYSDVHSEYKQTGIFDDFVRVIKTGVPVNRDRLFTGEGFNKWYATVTVKLDDSVVFSFHDITSEVVARQKLQSSEKRFRSIVEQAPVGICIVGGKPLKVEAANESYLKIVGKTYEELTAGPYWEVIPEAAPVYAPILDKVFQTGESYQALEHQLMLIKNGREEIIHVNFVCDPVKEEDGSVSKIMILVIEVTEQVLARKKIEESETNLRRLTDTVPALIWITAPGGNCTYLNKQWYDYTGQTSQEAEGFGWLDATHIDDKEEVGRLFTEANAEQKPFNALYRLRKKSGEYRWAIDSGSPRFATNGDYEGMIGTVVDVQEQKHAEEMLRYRQALLEAHNEVSVDGILLVDAKGRIISYNLRFIEIWNMPQEIVDAKDDDAALSFAMTQLVDPGQFIDKVKYLYEHPAETSVDELQFKDGKIIERHGYPVVGEDGTYYAWSWSFRDITRQKQAAKELVESSDKFRNLLEALPQMTWTNLPDGNVNFYNQMWYNYTGLNYEQTEGWRWKEVTHPIDLPSTVSAYEEALATGNIFVVENRYKRFDGQYRWHLNRALPIRNDKEEIILWVGTATDIHEQKTAEEQLEKLVSERTIQLERSNQDLQQFAHVASHDLKEPVRKIKIFTSGLQEELNDTLNEKNRLYLVKVQRAADRMSNMIDGVLTYSSINASEQTIETVDLNEVLNNIESDLEVIIQQKGALIHYGCLPVIEGASVLIYQLFYNLINNSLKFANLDEAPEISIMSETLHHPAIELAKIVIKDNGIGFEEVYADKIFETFARLNSKDEYEGTGLGLSLCKKIVQRHHGTIEAKGEVGKGAVFTITLPLKQKTNLI